MRHVYTFIFAYTHIGGPKRRLIHTLSLVDLVGDDAQLCERLLHAGVLVELFGNVLTQFLRGDENINAFTG